MEQCHRYKVYVKIKNTEQIAYILAPHLGLPGGSLKNTGHWQCQWHKMLSY